MPKVKLNIFGLVFLIGFLLMLFAQGKLFDVIAWVVLGYIILKMVLNSLTSAPSPKTESTSFKPKSNPKTPPPGLAKKLARR